MKSIPRRLLIVAFLTTAGLIRLAPLHGQAAEKQRGVLSDDAPAAPKPVGPYYALVIGNNDYQHVDKLQTAVNDAKEVSQLLHDRFGFETKVLYNATRAQILEAIDSYRPLPVDSNLLLYYAGHGYRDKEANQAYWLPIDAERDQRPNWINSADITGSFHAIKSRHILVISDSCFSGDLAMRDAKAAIASGGRNAIVAKALSLSSRHIMSSGGDEPVADSGTGGHSVFAAALLQSLNDMQDDMFRGNDLFDKVKSRVEMRSQANQTPRYDILRDSFADLGDFVFFRSSRTASGSPSSSRSNPSTPPMLPASKPASGSETTSRNILSTPPIPPGKSAEVLSNAEKYFGAGQYDRALPLFRSLAEAGNDEAALFLAYTYEGGFGLAKDEAQAVSWYRKAADAGNRRAMGRLGSMYEMGHGVAKDITQALSWYRKAAAQGDGFARNRLRLLGQK